MAAVTRLGPGGYPVAAAGSGPISGALNITEDNDTLTANGSSAQPLDLIHCKPFLVTMGRITQM